MSSPEPEHDPGKANPVAAIRRIDEICDWFEAALRAGERPVLEQYLKQVPRNDQDALRQHLLKLEAEYCSGAAGTAAWEAPSKRQSQSATSVASAKNARSDTEHGKKRSERVVEQADEIPRKIG
ncbi:MAG: hypothetical protein H8E44_45365 [Planctomycetes bacterium]|nr:hypothetical protein [Planctomycetota bacterium]MBL7038500.1 hypothetical protein [Pirellulaceae bacterium]